MQQREKENIQQAFKEKLDYDELMNCTRCGFCLPSCPTFIETGNEVHSPRGRIALMKGLVDGIIEPSEQVKRSIDLCLGCRACETACPSGVRFGRLLEQSREAIYQSNNKSIATKVARKMTFDHLFPYQNRIRNVAGLVSFYQRSGLQSMAYKSRLIKMIPENFRMMEKVLPQIPSKKEMKQRPTNIQPLKKRKKRVAFFSGCLMDTIFMKSNDATIKLLQYAGCEIVIPKTQGCCGALHGHSGEKNSALEMAKKNIEAFENEQVDYIITNAGGCGAFLVEYAHMFENDPEWKERALNFSNKIKDISQILIELNFDQLHLEADEQIVTYQDSCHLKNGQKTFNEPRKLIKAVKGVEYVEMKNADRCCGSAGIYNIIESEMSMKILNYKMDQVKQTKAKTIITSNPGCLLQMKLGIEREGLSGKVEAVHIVDFLVNAYENGLKRTKIS